MSYQSTRSNEDLAEISRADLFRTPPDTKRRVKTKSVSRTPSSSDTERELEQEEHESPLGRFANDKTPRAPQTSTMAESTAQDEIRRLREQLAQAEAALVEQGEPVDPDEEERMRKHEILLRRQEREENEQA